MRAENELENQRETITGKLHKIEKENLLHIFPL